MKLKIIIAIQTILIAFSLAFAFIKYGELKKEHIRLEEQTDLAMENAKRTEEYKAQAEHEKIKAERATVQTIKFEHALKKCLKGN